MLKTPKGLPKNKAGADQDKPATKKTKRLKNNTPNKTEAVLTAFLTGKSFNRLEARRNLHDHCLHSTVSYFVNEKGIVIDRRWETVKGYMGVPTRVKRYKLNRDPDNLKRARNLLDRGRVGGGAPCD